MAEEIAAPKVSEKKQKNPWMMVSVLLGVLLVASMAWNFTITAQVIARAGGTAAPA
ncbi:MAG: hypothetical protein HY367_02555, partial [Candidatus Aenigmarchaeota archaeon]|nr:hypothetical protein [Candidatus Aenigmarchaeota archaeon]